MSFNMKKEIHPFSLELTNILTKLPSSLLQDIKTLSNPKNQES